MPVFLSLFDAGSSAEAQIDDLFRRTTASTANIAVSVVTIFADEVAPWRRYRREIDDASTVCIRNVSKFQKGPSVIVFGCVRRPPHPNCCLEPRLFDEIRERRCVASSLRHLVVSQTYDVMEAGQQPEPYRDGDDSPTHSDAEAEEEDDDDDESSETAADKDTEQEDIADSEERLTREHLVNFSQKLRNAQPRYVYFLGALSVVDGDPVMTVIRRARRYCSKTDRAWLQVRALCAT